MDEYYSVYMTRKLLVNAGKSKVMVFERSEAEMVDFSTPYRGSVAAIGR